MADIALCVPDFYFSDAHFSHNIVPGDGMNFSYRVCVGQKRAAYMAYMEPKIDAKTALEWGLINEIVDHDQLIERAYEIARHIMKTGRAVRRLHPRRHEPGFDAVLRRVVPSLRRSFLIRGTLLAAVVYLMTTKPT